MEEKGSIGSIEIENDMCLRPKDDENRKHITMNSEGTRFKK